MFAVLFVRDFNLFLFLRNFAHTNVGEDIFLPQQAQVNPFAKKIRDLGYILTFDESLIDTFIDLPCYLHNECKCDKLCLVAQNLKIHPCAKTPDVIQIIVTQTHYTPLRFRDQKSTLLLPNTALTDKT